MGKLVNILHLYTSSSETSFSFLPDRRFDIKYAEQGRAYTMECIDSPSLLNVTKYGFSGLSGSFRNTHITARRFGWNFFGDVLRAIVLC